MDRLRILMLVVLLAFAGRTFAADTLAGKYPRAVLVQIRSENNRIERFKSRKEYRAMAEVISDALAARKAMINDFTTNFHYCPVYYYIDTNAELVKQKKFDNILLDTAGMPVVNPIINSNSKDYIVVYYGYRIVQSNGTHVVKDSTKYITDPQNGPGKGLVILNDKFLQISYIYKLGYADLLLGKKKQRADYYASKTYDIDYFPLAKTFNEKLVNKGKKNRIKKGQERIN